MNIAFFSECWDPQINGVVTSTKALAGALKVPRDKVYVFAPRYPRYQDANPNVFRQPAVRYFFQPEFFFASPLPFGALKKAREWNIDIVHLHSEFTLGMAAIQASRALAVPSVLTLHTLWEFYSHYFLWDMVPRSLFRYFLSLLYKMPDYFIAPSKKARDYLTGIMKVKKPIEIIPTGIMLEKFHNAKLNIQERNRLRKQWGINPRDIVLMFAARIGREKSINVLIDGIVELAPRYPSIRLLLVGGGPHVARLKQYAASRKVNKNVIFTGYIPYDQMPAVYRASDIFTIASVSETQGLVTVEALASGLPVIVKNDPASVEMIGNGRYGLIFNNDKEFPRTVDHLLTHPALMEELKSRAREGSQGYDAAAYGKRVRDYYEWIIRDYRQRKK